MIYENYEFPIPSGCELMKVNRGYYVYLRLKATDKPKKICIGRCKFSADQTKTLIPNTNFSDISIIRCRKEQRFESRDVPENVPPAQLTPSCAEPHCTWPAERQPIS